MPYVTLIGVFKFASIFSVGHLPYISIKGDVRIAGFIV